MALNLNILFVPGGEQIHTIYNEPNHPIQWMDVAQWIRQHYDIAHNRPIRFIYIGRELPMGQVVDFDALPRHTTIHVVVGPPLVHGGSKSKKSKKSIKSKKSRKSKAHMTKQKRKINGVTRTVRVSSTGKRYVLLNGKKHYL